MPSTTAELLQSLDTILFEIGRMEDIIRDARDVADPDRRQLRQEITELRALAERLMHWLGEQRLEEPKQ